MYNIGYFVKPLLLPATVVEEMGSISFTTVAGSSKGLTYYPMLYTGCNRRNGPDLGRVFLMLNYTEKPQNTYIQSSMVTEI